MAIKSGVSDGAAVGDHSRHNTNLPERTNRRVPSRQMHDYIKKPFFKALFLPFANKEPSPKLPFVFFPPDLYFFGVSKTCET